MKRLSVQLLIALLLMGGLGVGGAVNAQTTSSSATTPPLEIKQTVDPERIFLKGTGHDPQETDVTLSLMAPVGERMPIDLFIAVDRSATVNLSQMTAIGVAILDQAGPQDRVGLVSFASEAKVDVGLTENRRAVEDGLKKLLNVGRTAIGEGIFTTVNELVDTGRSEANWAIVLLTDGRSNTGRAPLTQAQRAADSGVTIFTIGVGRSIDRAVMSEIAKITGGQFFEKFNDTVPRAIFRSFERTILARSLRVVETLPAELNYESSSEHSPARVTQNANKTTTLEWTIDELRFGEEWKTVFKVTGNKEGAFLINARPSKLSYADFRGKKIDRDLPNTSLKVLSMPRPPIAGFDFTPSNPSANDEVSFIDQSSAPGGAVASWLWDFGDGTTSNQASPTHKYAQDGVYTVTLTVTDADGLTNTKTRTVKVETLRVTVKREINTYLPNDETLPQQTFSVTLNIQVNQKLLGMGIEEILPDKWTVIEKDGNTARFRAEGTKQQWLFSEELTAGTVKTITYDVKLNQGANSGKIVGKVSSAFPAFETMITGENSVKIATQLPFRVLLSRWDPSKQVGNNDPEDEPAPLNIRMGDKLTQEQVLAAVGWWQGNPALPGYFSKRAKEKLSLQVMQELIAYWLTDTSVLESLPPIK